MAWDGTDYKTGLRMCVCLSVCASWSIVTKIGTDVKPPKLKRVRWCQHRTIPSPILPPKSPF